jgi:hypothetical protein
MRTAMSYQPLGSTSVDAARGRRQLVENQLSRDCIRTAVTVQSADSFYLLAFYLLVRRRSSIDALRVETIAPLHDRCNQSGHIKRAPQPAHRHVQSMLIGSVRKAGDQLLAREH